MTLKETKLERNSVREDEFPLRLDIQYFAEPGDGGTAGGEGGAIEVPKEPEGAQSEDTKTGEEKTFTQAELDQILTDRLAREKRARDEEIQKEKDEAERKRLEDQGEYKTLLEQAQKDLADRDAQISLRDRKESIREKLTEKGLSAEEVSLHSKYVERLVSDDSEIESAIEEVFNDFSSTKQPQYKEPAAGFPGTKKEPESKSDEDYGRELFNRLRG